MQFKTKIQNFSLRMSDNFQIFERKQPKNVNFSFLKQFAYNIHDELNNNQNDFQANLICT